MPREYDFEFIKRAYAEIARRALARDEKDRRAKDADAARHSEATFEAAEDVTGDEAER